MVTRFNYLFTPVRVGPITVRNRILSTAHFVSYGQNNLPTDRFANYYAEKAKGGIGLIVMEYQAVHVTAQANPEIVFAWDERTIPGYQMISAMVHEHGAKILAQLNHTGQHTTGVHNMREAWAPSALASVRVRTIPKAMEIQDIQEIIQGFGKGARNLKLGGFDGVEIHGGHGYLLSQFLSPLFNKRTDEYGGSLDNRLRITLETIDAIREQCGRDFVLGIRISGDELTTGGLTLEDMKVVAQRLEATGNLDYISVSIANYNSFPFIVPPMFVPLGYAVYLAAGIKEAIDSIPIFTIGRINDPLLAEKILADGHADMIGMTRATIADPELPNKAREGRLEEIRPCIACNEGCIGRRGRHTWVSCLQNPTAGREKELGRDTLRPAAVRKAVMIVGGGPAGMEAAWVAASRGHHVTLYEKADRLGGQINLLTRVASREEFAGVTRWRTDQLKKLGVETHLDTEVTCDLVSKVCPDVVIVATGSLAARTGFTPVRPELPGIPGADQDNVLTYWEVLQDEKKLGDKIVLIDDDHDYRAGGTAEFLVDRGKQVEIICRLPSVASDTGLTTSLSFLYRKLLRGGVVFTANSWCRQISGKRVVVYNIYTSHERTIEDVDTVVLATANVANDSLYRELKGKVKELYAIGDCLAPRKAIDAIFDGHRIARHI